MPRADMIREGKINMATTPPETRRNLFDEKEAHLPKSEEFEGHISKTGEPTFKDEVIETEESKAKEARAQEDKMFDEVFEEVLSESAVSQPTTTPAPVVVSKPATNPVPVDAFAFTMILALATVSKPKPEISILSDISRVEFDKLDEADRQKFIELVRLRIQIQDEILMLVVNHQLNVFRTRKQACLKSSNYFACKIVNIADLKEYYHNLCGGDAAIHDKQNLKIAIAKLDAMLSRLEAQQNELKDKQYHPRDKAAELKEKKAQLDALAAERDRCRQECQELEEREKSYAIPSQARSIKLLELGALEGELRVQTHQYNQKSYSYNDVLDSAMQDPDMKELRELQKCKSEMYAAGYEYAVYQKHRKELEENKENFGSIVYLGDSEELDLLQEFYKRSDSYEKKLKIAKKTGKIEKPYSASLKKAEEAVEVHVYKAPKCAVPPKYQAVINFMNELKFKDNREEKIQYLRKFLDSQQTKGKESIDYYQKFSFFTYGRGKTETRMLMEGLLNALVNETDVQKNISQNIKFRPLCPH